MNAWKHDDGPSAVLTRLDRAARDLGIRTTASVAIAKIEPFREQATPNGAATRRVRLSNAGHPPPIALRADGGTEMLSASRCDLLLGVEPSVARTDHLYPLESGSTLFLYTDGLIETRTDSIDSGIDRLRQALTSHAALAAEDLLDAVLDELIGDGPADDVAVLAVRPVH